MKIWPIVQFLTERLKEPSTQASLAAFCGVIGLQVDAGMVQDVCLGICGISALCGFAIPEKKGE